MITIGLFNYLEYFFLFLFTDSQEVAPEPQPTSRDPPKHSLGAVAKEVKPHWVGQCMDNQIETVTLTTQARTIRLDGLFRY